VNVKNIYAMKILHTSDWHLGHRLLENLQAEEQQLFLNWLTEYIQTNGIDILLICGDVFDTGTPSSQSLKMYYDFLIGLKQTACKKVIVTGGNHDAPGTLNAPKELLEYLSVHVVGKATNPVDNEIIEVEKGNEKVTIAAVPFLRDSDIRKAVAGESIDDISSRYKRALINHYAMLSDICKANKNKGIHIAMGHLFAVGGTTTDSEQSIYVGNLGDIGADDFPYIFDYIALGHLHKAQKIGGKNHIRYCGTPYPLSFSEANSNKQVIVLETKNDEILSIEDVTVPIYRNLFRVTGTLQECISKLSIIDTEKYSLTPWVEVVLDNEGKNSIGFAEIEEVSRSMNLEILKVALKREHEIQGIETLLEDTVSVKELSPLEVFKMKCAEQNFNLDNNPEIWDAYNEILQKALENNG